MHGACSRFYAPPRRIFGHRCGFLRNAHSLALGWVSQMQRGFLRGRSMLSNVVDIDTEAMTVSLRHDKGALVLFDFAAAFPSMSQTYMLTVLKHLGLPAASMHFLEALYDNKKCVISCKGCIYEGFPMTAGIRQGCLYHHCSLQLSPTCSSARSSGTSLVVCPR